VLQSLPATAAPNDFILSSREGRVPISGFSKAKAAIDGKASKLLVVEGRSESLQRYRIHDFRVTCETRLATLGFNQEIRDAVLGHAKQGLQKTYNKHDYFDEKKAALVVYANHVIEVIQ
jgi:hypothetical protein